MKTSKAHPDQKFGNITYSQHGEDLVILNIFESIGIQKPSYLDLGAHDPDVISNTKLLYERGSRGINVEANPVLHRRLCESRPEDTNILGALSGGSGFVNFYRYSATSGRNTTDAAEVERMKGTLEVEDVIQVPGMRLETAAKPFLRIHERYPDFLNCDIEGKDYEILAQLSPPPGFERHVNARGVEVKFFQPVILPKVICVETRKSQTNAMTEMLEQRGYGCYCRIGANLIFVRFDFVSQVYTGNGE